MTSNLQIKLFGAPQFIYNDQPLTGFVSNKARAVLIYLAVTGRPHSRDALSELLWADTPTTRRKNLKKVLSNLRKLGGVTLLEEGRQTVALDPDCYWLDVHEFCAGIDQEKFDQMAIAERCLSLCEENFLNGFNISLSIEFEEWALSQQSQLNLHKLELLNSLTDAFVAQQQLPKAISTVRQLLKVEPWQEGNHRRLIELLAQQGDIGGALAHFEACRESLRAELDVEPSASTIALVEQIRSGTFVPKQPPPAPHQDAVRKFVPNTQKSKTKVEFELVGRDAEWQIVRAAWETLAQSKYQQTDYQQSHFVCIGGEAGIGKTRLAEELLMLAEDGGAAVARTRSHELQGQLAFGPITDWLRSAPLQAKLDQLDEVWRTEVARLLPDLLADGLAEPKPLKQSWQRKHFFDALVHAFAAVDEPLLLVLDDLQWTDADTLEWLQYLIESSDAPILVCGTARLSEVTPDHRLHRVRAHLQRQDKFTEVRLSELTATATNQLAATVKAETTSDDTTSDEMDDGLFEETAGNPLFVIESMRAGSSDLIMARPSVSIYPQPEADQNGVAIPAKIYSVLQYRLTLLSPQAQQLAQLCAAIGRAFDTKLLAQATGGDEDVVLILLDEMWQRRIIKEVDAVHFDFAHDRIRDVAYAETGPIKRRVLHRSVASTLAVMHEGNTGAVAAQIAVHYETAGATTQAVAFFQQAAAEAERLYAYHDAVLYFERAIQLLRGEAQNSDAKQLEIKLLIALSEARTVAEGKGAPAIYSDLQAANSLVQDFGTLAQNAELLSALAKHARVCGEWHKAYELGTQLLAVVEELDDPEQSQRAKYSQIVPLIRLGKLEKAQAQFEQLPVRSLTGKSKSVNVSILTRSAYLLWLLGFPNQARRRAMAAARSGHKILHESTTITLHHSASVHLFCMDVTKVDELSAELVELTTERGDDFSLRWGLIYRGWLLVQQGKISEGIAMMRENADEHRARNNYFYECVWRSLLAEAYLMANDVDSAMNEIDETLAYAKKSGDVHWNAQLLKQKGDCLRAVGARASAVRKQYEQAIETAREQKSRALELRATTSLCHLLLDQGEVGHAYDRLAPIYGWFTEGFDTADLIEAKKLLEELRLSVPTRDVQREYA